MEYKAPTTDEWLAKARANATKLESLIASYHPVNRQPGTRHETVNRPGDFITAPGAEAACVAIRRDIRDKYNGDPIADFKAALERGDVTKLISLLNSAWFGVPESTQCWKLEGFKEAVDLLEDMPDSMVED